MDNITQYFLPLLTIAVPVIVSVLIFIYQRRLNRRRLSYDILSNNSLVNSHIKENKIKFLYDGNELDDLTLVVIKIINDGNTDITKDDFDKSIEIHFGGHSEILSVEAIKTYPNNLDLKFGSIADILDIEPMLLNKSEYFIFKLLLKGTLDENIKPNIRIKVISEITKVKKQMHIFQKMYLYFNFVCIGALGVTAFALFSNYKIGITSIFVGFISLLSAGFAFLFLKEKLKL